MDVEKSEKRPVENRGSNMDLVRADIKVKAARRTGWRVQWKDSCFLLRFHRYVDTFG
jgi:hypothetical protein